ncbi:hypothetical protein WDU94_002529 [Cyamophila willieti]
MPEVASKRKAAPAAKEEAPKRAGRGRPPAKAEVEKVEKPAPAPKKVANDGEPPAKRGRGRPPKDGVKAKPKKLKYPGKGRGRPKATDVPVPQSDDDE